MSSWKLKLKIKFKSTKIVFHSRTYQDINNIWYDCSRPIENDWMIVLEGHSHISSSTTHNQCTKFKMNRGGFAIIL